MCFNRVTQTCKYNRFKTCFSNECGGNDKIHIYYFIIYAFFIFLPNHTKNYCFQLRKEVIAFSFETLNISDRNLALLVQFSEYHFYANILKKNFEMRLLDFI